MEVAITTVTKCNGGNHYTFTGTLDGVQKIRTFMRDDIMANPDDIEQAFLQRLRSFLKENTITTFAAAKAALEGITFKL